jgi:hypothetical protein
MEEATLSLKEFFMHNEPGRIRLKLDASGLKREKVKKRPPTAFAEPQPKKKPPSTKVRKEHSFTLTQFMDENADDRANTAASSHTPRPLPPAPSPAPQATRDALAAPVARPTEALSSARGSVAKSQSLLDNDDDFVAPVTSKTRRLKSCGI